MPPFHKQKMELQLLDFIDQTILETLMKWVMRNLKS